MGKKKIQAMQPQTPESPKRYGVWQEETVRHGRCWRRYDLRVLDEAGRLQRKIGSGFATKAECETAVAALRLAARENKYGFTRPKAECLTTVGNAVESYIKALTERWAAGHGTRYAARSAGQTNPIRRWAEFVGAEKAVKNLTKQDFLLWTQSEIARGQQPASVQRRLNNIRAALNYARETAKDLREFKIPRYSLGKSLFRERMRILDEAEIRAIATELQTNPGWRDAYDFFRVALGSGGRFDEIAPVVIRRDMTTAGIKWSDINKKQNTLYNDGFVTTRNTFQKYYEQNELKQFVDEVLEKDAVPVGLGVYFVFRDETQAETFRASRFRSRATYSLSKIQIKNFADYLPTLQPLVDFIAERGRLAIDGEIENENDIKNEFRTLARAFEVIKRSTNADEWNEIIEKRKEDLLVYIALSRFQRRPQFTALPSELRTDIKAFFGTYKQACDLGDKLLFSLGQNGTIQTACRQSSIGKFVGNALYVHTSALNELNSILRVYEGCASRTFGQLEQTTIIKFRADKPKVSYLFYPDFDKDAHPALHSSMQANLSSLYVDFRDYSSSENPPILHRKETFVDKTYPSYKKFAKLTAQEEKYGLLNEPIAIGTKRNWEQRLDDKKVQIRGHRVILKKD